jgi:hypothetical protein
MFSKDLKNGPIYREDQFSEGPVLRKFTVMQIWFTTRNIDKDDVLAKFSPKQ